MPRPTLLGVRAATLAATVLAAPPLAGAQDAPIRTGPVFQESIDVRVLNIEAVVTDRHGARIRGLGPGDFRVTVDGEETAIDFFSEIDNGLATTSVVTQGATPRPAPVAEGRRVPTRFLVFIDNLFSIAPHRNEVLDALEEDVDQLGPDEWMAIVTFDGVRLELLSGWENRPDPLRQALQIARAAPSYGFHRLREVRQVDDFRDMEREHLAMMVTLMLGNSSGGPVSGADVSPAQEQGAGDFRAIESLQTLWLERTGGIEVDFAYMVRSQVRRAALAASAAMRGFGRSDGRKAMLVLAGGWPSSRLGVRHQRRHPDHQPGSR